MHIKFLTIIFISFFLFSCSSLKESKEYIKDNSPLKEASRKESLAEAREDVKKSKKAYMKCMEQNDQDIYNCVPQREQYDKDTDRYIELQQSNK